jgi:hypothetical protein
MTDGNRFIPEADPMTSGLRTSVLALPRNLAL